MNGNTSEVSIPSVIRRGTTVANELLKRSAQAYGTTDGNWTADRIYVPASRPVAPTNPFTHNTRNWDYQQTSSVQLNHTWNAEAAQGSAKRFTGQLNGAEKYSLTYGGQGTFADGITGKYLSGAGKTTVVDGDFTTAPGNGAMAVHFDTTASKTYLSVRANGTWHVMAGPL